MRHLFIINPAAGRPESTARLETLLSRLSFPHEVAYTREAGDAQRLAATAARTGGPVRIYACGGDGTVHEAANGIAGLCQGAGEDLRSAGAVRQQAPAVQIVGRGQTVRQGADAGSLVLLPGMGVDQKDMAHDRPPLAKYEIRVKR